MIPITTRRSLPLPKAAEVEEDSQESYGLSEFDWSQVGALPEDSPVGVSESDREKDQIVSKVGTYSERGLRR